MRGLLCSALLAAACGSGGPRPEADAAAAEVASGLEVATAAEMASEATTIERTEPARATILARYDFGRRTRRADLPGRLDEISGLAFTSDGRLFAHDDERGRVHEIDPTTGAVGKRFDLGASVVRADFEGLAIVGERFFLITSAGVLYEFREGDDEAELEYRMTDAGLGGTCEVEGLDHDPTEDWLLIACKTSTDRASIVVHRLPLDPRRDRPEPLRIPKSSLTAHGLDADFDASGIAVDPSGAILLVAARQAVLIEVDRTGAVVAAVALSDDRHPQAEGLALGPDGTLFIADERNGRTARLTAYAVVDRNEPR